MWTVIKVDGLYHVVNRATGHCDKEVFESKRSASALAFLLNHKALEPIIYGGSFETI